MRQLVVHIGSDHRGFKLKQALISAMTDWGMAVRDAGAYSDRRTDFPPVAFQVAEAVVKHPGARGVLMCGSGIGMDMAANKVLGARAALVNNNSMAKQAVEHDQANIIVLPANYVTVAQAKRLLKTFLQAQPDSDVAHRRRVKQISAYERSVKRSAKRS